jgi:hypothetical protein
MTHQNEALVHGRQVNYWAVRHVAGLSNAQKRLQKRAKHAVATVSINVQCDAYNGITEV